MKLFHLILVLFLPISLSAQQIDLPTEYVMNSYSGRNSLPQNVTGTQYPDDSFKKGEILIDGKNFEALTRYNSYKDLFEIKTQENDISEVARNLSMEVEIGDYTYKMYEYLNENGNISRRFFKTIYDGDHKLLLLQTAELRPGQEATSSYTQPKPPSLNQKSEYYMMISEKPAVELNLRKKSVLKILDNKNAEEYVKSNKLKLKSEEEIVKLLKHLDLQE